MAHESDWDHYTIASVEPVEDEGYALWRLHLVTTDMMLQIDRRQLVVAPQPGERVSVNWALGPDFERIAYGERTYKIGAERNGE